MFVIFALEPFTGQPNSMPRYRKDSCEPSNDRNYSNTWRADGNVHREPTNDLSINRISISAGIKSHFRHSFAHP